LLRQSSSRYPTLARASDVEHAERIGRVDDPERVEGAALRALRKLLDEKDSKQEWGGLRKGTHTRRSLPVAVRSPHGRNTCARDGIGCELTPTSHETRSAGFPHHQPSNSIRWRRSSRNSKHDPLFIHSSPALSRRRKKLGRCRNCPRSTRCRRARRLIPFPSARDALTLDRDKSPGLPT